MSVFRICCRCLFAVLALCLALLIITNCVMLGISLPYMKDSKKADAHAEMILVLGAGIKEDGTPSVMLKDRLDTAYTLYEKGCAPSILLSGDTSGEHYDEIASMRTYLLDRGVPPSAILTDGAGYSTRESMKNTAKSYGECRVIIVTQKYHLPRAIALARAEGMIATGVYTDTVPDSLPQFYRDIRELLARTKDFFYLFS